MTRGSRTAAPIESAESGAKAGRLAGSDGKRSGGRDIHEAVGLTVTALYRH